MIKHYKYLMAFLIVYYNTSSMCMHPVLFFFKTIFTSTNEQASIAGKSSRMVAQQVQEIVEFKQLYNEKFVRVSNLTDAMNKQQEIYRCMNFFQKNFTSQGWYLKGSINENAGKLHIATSELTSVCKVGWNKGFMQNLRRPSKTSR